MNNIISESYTKTLELAGRLIEDGLIKSGSFVALYGTLGSGKTAFVNGIVSELCKRSGSPAIQAHSPTFTIINEYPTLPPVFHFDMYRIKSEEDLFQTGFYDYFERDGIIITEWSENIEYAIPENAIRVFFEYGRTENERSISFKLVQKE